MKSDMNRAISVLVAMFFSLICINSGAQDKKKDWAQFYRYSDANDLVHENGTRVKAVLMGDSITDNWLKFEPEWFTDNNLQGRGISGQVTSQMLVRFQEDVVKIHPKYVAILAGTNDIAQNNGEITLEHVMDNLKSMCEIAKANRIKVVLCSVLPVSQYSWRPDLKPAGEVKALNAMMHEYARTDRNVVYLDYWTILANEEGGLDNDKSGDGCHPNRATYKIMEELLLRALK